VDRFASSSCPTRFFYPAFADLAELRTGIEIGTPDSSDCHNGKIDHDPVILDSSHAFNVFGQTREALRSSSDSRTPQKVTMPSLTATCGLPARDHGSDFKASTIRALTNMLVVRDQRPSVCSHGRKGLDQIRAAHDPDYLAETHHRNLFDTFLSRRSAISERGVISVTVATSCVITSANVPEWDFVYSAASDALSLKMFSHHDR
jgi:hypothetical protein